LFSIPSPAVILCFGAVGVAFGMALLAGANANVNLSNASLNALMGVFTGQMHVRVVPSMSESQCPTPSITPRYSHLVKRCLLLLIYCFAYLL
jgi:hypothetical protein